MKLYPKDALERFEFDLIKDRLASLCNSNVGKELATELIPYHDRKELKLRLQQSEELLEIEANDLSFPEIAYPGVASEIKWLKIQGSKLDGQSFIKIAHLCEVIRNLYRFLHEQREELPALYSIVELCEDPKPLIGLINTNLEENGKVRSSASRKLSDIRKSLDSERSRSKRKFDSILRKYKKLGWLREFDESYYNNRRVLAVESEYKRKIKGIIHGISESGRSAFIEPLEMLEMNNHISSLEQDELLEVNRILKELTKEVAHYLPSIEMYNAGLGMIDFTRAKVKLAIQMDARMPEINTNGKIKLRNAYHPVLSWFLKKENKKSIPLNLELSKESRLLVISGPNAGGKSIALKTLGLLQIMLQSGLLIPVDEGSTMIFFNKLFVDIGDDQSIEYELSTFSSRLVKMKYFLEFADQHTILFIDEFGTGSDPDLGGALAEVMLEDLVKSKPYGMITTHYNNIKVFAENTDGVTNGSMLFELSNLAPLFKLEQGQPGSSFTFEVASKIGLTNELLDRAKSLVSDQKVNFDRVLVQLQARKNELNRKNRQLSKNQKILADELERTKDEFEYLQEKLTQLNDPENQKRIEQGRKYIRLLESYQKSKNKKEILKRVVIAADKWSDAIKKEQLKDEAQKVKEKQHHVRKQKKEKKKQQTIQKSWVPQVGDLIKIGDGKQTGEIKEIKKGKALVHFGSMKTIVDVDKIIVVRKEKTKKDGNQANKQST
jgi:DNA mismatch repair protein MutS2